ncbi:MAG TPA: phosphoheptose isomerase [Gammaproteobacteria bacterium]|nr:phosphoheptose isomerase [Gammaproteobacteria bacterium]|tara:strand:- start:191 stop:784 length:594 start_codon:yes stop_codon:yes gene_type:complete
MDRLKRVQQNFDESITLKTEAAFSLGPKIVEAADSVLACLMANNKLMACGNGGSAADAQHLSSEMLNRFERERPGLAAIALTTDASTITSVANDYQFADVFSRQIRALGRPGDVVMAFSTSGQSNNIVSAIDAAHDQDARVVLVSGRDGGEAAKTLSKEDIEIRVPSASTARIQEVHIMIVHCICDLIDDHLLGYPD